MMNRPDILLLLLAGAQERESERKSGGVIHTTIGVYLNTDRAFWKINGVSEDHLESHIEYNMHWRPGWALFVNGVCVYRGSVRDEDILRIEAELASEPIVLERDTAPYH